MSNESNNVQLNNQSVCNLEHLKLGMWNINGLSKWKRGHIDMINMINNNDITLIVETWISDQECELTKQDNWKILQYCTSAGVETD